MAGGWDEKIKQGLGEIAKTSGFSRKKSGLYFIVRKDSLQVLKWQSMSENLVKQWLTQSHVCSQRNLKVSISCWFWFSVLRLSGARSLCFSSYFPHG